MDQSWRRLADSRKEASSACLHRFGKAREVLEIPQKSALHSGAKAYVDHTQQIL